jgi:hypothetical protein
MRRPLPDFLTTLLVAILCTPFVSGQEMQEMAMKDAAMKPGVVAKVEEKMDPAGLEFFEKNVRPILTERCYKCHSAAESSSKGGLLLDSRVAMLAGGDQGPAVVPNNLKKSLLILSVHQTDPELSMPPRSKGGPKLTDEQIKTLEKWVMMGAPAPVGSGATKLTGLSQKARDHWAFKSVVVPEIPSVRNQAWAQNEIDVFVMQKLEQNGLKPNPATDGDSLLRRLTYDLHGMPPTPAESDAFARDYDAAIARDVYAMRNGQPARAASLVVERVVDRLLASPRYGERWARHWLDTARYSDTRGNRRDIEGERFPSAWTYRDYVIEALNTDKPYDQFIIEQLAADRLPDLSKDDPRLAALGFITVGKRFDNNDDTIDERIDTTSKAFLGLTVSCARCHDHKFDPIPAADYYSMHGIFASTIEPMQEPIIRGTRIGNAAERADYDKKLRELVESNTRGYYRYIAAQLGILHKEFAGRALFQMAGQRSEKGFDIQKQYKFEPVREIDGSINIAPNSPITGPLARVRRLTDAEFSARAPEVLAAALTDKKYPVNPLVVEALANLKPKTLDDVALAYQAMFQKHHARIVAHIGLRGSPGGAGERDDKALAQLAAWPWPLPNYEEVASTPLMTVLISTRSFCESWQSAPSFRNGNIPPKYFRFDDLNKLELTHPGGPGTAMVVADSERPKNTPVYIRGDRNKPGPVAPRQFLEILAGPDRQPFFDGSGRRELAVAIASRTNPLTARVLVNRVWMHHFGAGIVSSPDDFGNMSEKPSHPELLDWMSANFVDAGWSLKKLHRKILTSQTYRQSANPLLNPLVAQKGEIDPMKVDAGNKFLWRSNLRRLDFECIRDAMIMLTGKMDLSVGGRPVNITEEPISYRRSIYGYIDRDRLSDLQSQFDFADPSMANSKRGTTIVPQQALFFMNNPLSVEVARAVAARPEFLSASSDEARVAVLYRVMFQRVPKPEEVRLAKEFVKKVAGFIDEPAPTAKPKTPVASTKVTKEQAKEMMNKPLLPSTQTPSQAATKGATTIAGGVIVNLGEKISRKTPSSPWEMLAQAMICSNEFVYLD